MAALAWWRCCCLALLAQQAVLLRIDVEHHLRQPPDSPGLQFQEEWLEDLVSEGPLAHTQAASQPEPEEAEPLNTAVLAYPPAKLVFCPIPKNADAQFHHLFNALNGVEGFWDASALGRHGLTKADVSRERGWKWAVFVRNPLVRYLSAWGSKCLLQEDQGRLCEPFLRVSNHPPNTTASVKDFENNVLANWKAPHRPPRNTHWTLQQNFCGGLKDAKDYDFVGHLGGDVHGQVLTMLEMVGAPVDRVEEFFPRVGVAGHFSKLSPTLYYSNATLKRMVSEMYLADYRLPGLGSQLPPAV